MRTIYIILLGLILTVKLQAQPLVNTSWHADSALVHGLSGAGQIDSLKIFFKPGNVFTMNAYDTSHDSVSQGVWWQISDSSFGWVDTANRAFGFGSVCHSTDTAIVRYKIHDSLLLITNVIDQCSLRGTVLIGSEWFGNNGFTVVKNIHTASFIVSPNPFADNINIRFENGNISGSVHFQIYDVQGKIRRKGSIDPGAGSFMINGLAELPGEIYYLQLKDNSYISYTKIVKL